MFGLVFYFMDDITTRLNHIAQKHKLDSFANFSRKTGLSHQTASNYLKGKQKPDLDNLAKIILAFPDFNPTWIITGLGDQINTQHASKNTLESRVRELIREELNIFKEQFEVLKLMDQVNFETLKALIEQKNNR